MTEARELTCQVCGKKFISSANIVKYCSKACCNEACRIKTREAAREKAQQRKRRENSFDNQLKLLDEYNKKHGTHLSYGKFMSLSGVI